MLTEQHIPMQEGQLPIITSNSSVTGKSWPSVHANSAQQALQVLPSQIKRSSLLALMPTKKSFRMLTPSTASPQQQKKQQQQQQHRQQPMGHAVGLAKPMLTDQPPTDQLQDANRYLATHTMGHTHIDLSRNQGSVGAAMPAAAQVLLPLLDAANFINEPACFAVGPSGSSPNHVTAPLYTSCFQHSKNQPPDDSAVQSCQAAPATLDLEQAPDFTAYPASLVIPFKATDPYCRQPVPHPMLNSPHSIQILHSSQQLTSHDHAVSFGTQQTEPQASCLKPHASLQQMSHDVHRPQMPHTLFDSCHNGRVYDDQPSTSAWHMPLQSVTSTDVPVGEDQERAQADPAATFAAAEGLDEGFWPRCHSSISTDSR